MIMVVCIKSRFLQSFSFLSVYKLFDRNVTSSSRCQTSITSVPKMIVLIETLGSVLVGRSRTSRE